MPNLSSIITPGNVITSDNEITLTNKTLTDPIIQYVAGDTSFTVPAGTTGERPSSPETGELRFNTDEGSLEQYDGTNWGAVVPDDLDINTLSINGTQVVDSSGNIDTGSVSINGTQILDSSGNIDTASVSINGSQIVDSSGNIDTASLSVGGTEVIDNSRKLAEFRVNTQTISSNTNASTGVFYVATAELTLTLPSSPSVGDIVGFQNSSDTEECVIARNGENILSLAEDMTIDALNASVNLQYSGSSAGWVFV